MLSQKQGPPRYLSISSQVPFVDRREQPVGGSEGKGANDFGGRLNRSRHDFIGPQRKGRRADCVAGEMAGHRIARRYRWLGGDDSTGFSAR